jgi:hypothetical protein
MRFFIRQKEGRMLHFMGDFCPAKSLGLCPITRISGILFEGAVLIFNPRRQFTP